jgi:hypothetical protein
VITRGMVILFMHFISINCPEWGFLSCQNANYDAFLNHHRQPR